MRPLAKLFLNINGSTQTVPPAIPEAQRKILTYLGVKPEYQTKCPKSDLKLVK